MSYSLPYPKKLANKPCSNNSTTCHINCEVMSGPTGARKDTPEGGC